MKKNELTEKIQWAQSEFKRRMEWMFENGGMKKEQYAGILQMQYWLTNGVIHHFYSLAAHPIMQKKKGLRKFLIQFGNEEEMHYLIAQKDLKELGSDVGSKPIEVDLWYAFYDRMIIERPFVRLGATCVLENITSGSGEILTKLMQADYITKSNCRFVTIHRHEELPHGDQILEAIDQADCNDDEMYDLVEGARIGAELYLILFDRSIGFEFAKNVRPHSSLGTAA